jgi:hypothetical protein
MDQLVDEGDQQDHEAAAVAELRNPQRHRDHALRDVVKFQDCQVMTDGMPGERSR